MSAKNYNFGLVSHLPTDAAQHMLEYLEFRDQVALANTSTVARRVMDGMLAWTELQECYVSKEERAIGAMLDLHFPDAARITAVVRRYVFDEVSVEQRNIARGRCVDQLEQIPRDLVLALGGIRAFVDMPEQRHARTLSFERLRGFMGPEEMEDWPSITKGIDRLGNPFFVLYYATRKEEAVLTAIRKSQTDNFRWILDGRMSIALGKDPFGGQRSDWRVTSKTIEALRRLVSGKDPEFAFIRPNFGLKEEELRRQRKAGVLHNF